MKIYMAGGINGNLKAYWNQLAQNLSSGGEYTEACDNAMRVFLAGGERRHNILYGDILDRGKWQNANNTGDSSCDCFWQGSPRGGAEGGYDQYIRNYHPFILESFYYCDSDTERLLPYYGDFLLDSGAFTFMQGSGTANFDDYVERYADFINRNHIEKYFELDVDVVTGYEKVLQYRKRLEQLTSRPCIPVWHKSRKLEEFIKMCQEYSYVAIGGIVSKEIKPDEYNHFPKLINIAHKNGAKIHGLGFTNLACLQNYHFDSVDSTAWTTGNRFGYLYYFDGKTMRKREPPKGHRIADSRAAAINNYIEWIKYQQYAEVNL